MGKVEMIKRQVLAERSGGKKNQPDEEATEEPETEEEGK